MLSEVSQKKIDIIQVLLMWHRFFKKKERFIVIYIKKVVALGDRRGREQIDKGDFKSKKMDKMYIYAMYI